jgi:hypothetical protein
VLLRQARRALLTLEIRAGANQTVLEIVELLAGIRRAASAFDGQVDTPGELVVDKAAIGHDVAGASVGSTGARFDTGQV